MALLPPNPEVLNSVSLIHDQTPKDNNAVNNALEAMKSGTANYAALLIQKLSIRPQQKMDDSIMEVADTLGEPFAESKETGTHNPIQEITPDDRVADLQTSSSSTTPLRLHTENLGTENIPDWVLIACAQNLEKAPTLIVNPVETVRVMGAIGLTRQLQLLREPAFGVQEPTAFALATGRDEGERKLLKDNIPIISGLNQSVGEQEGAPVVEVDFEAMTTDSYEHKNALAVFEVLAQKMAHKVVTRQGDLLVIRNTAQNRATNDGIIYASALHGRDRFVPMADSQRKRKLKRVFVRGRESIRT
ncbi:MAG TPA: hypothetical protein VD947_04720 [Patescibacteria group bacterium]|nr:hypothetical protein [Patescibacteria group bacterium]